MHANLFRFKAGSHGVCEQPGEEFRGRVQNILLEPSWTHA